MLLLSFTQSYTFNVYLDKKFEAIRELSIIFPCNDMETLDPESQENYNKLTCLLSISFP